MNKLFKPIAISLGIYAVLSLADGFIALPLRQLSSMFSYFFLKAAAFPVMLEGTTLSTPNMRFDVIPACNGSTTLRVMLLTGIVWIGIQDKLKLNYKIICSLGIVPLALIINGLRLFILVVMSHFLYEPVEGILHSITGVGAFLMGMIILVAITTVLESENHEEVKGSNSLMVIASILAVFFTFLPFFMWTFQAWKSSPIDRVGYVYVLISLCLYIYSWKSSPKGAGCIKTASVFFVLSLLILVIATVAEINILSAISFFVLICSFQLLFFGRKYLLVHIPLLLLALIGIPATAFVITKGLFFILGKSSGTLTLVIQICFAISMIAAWFFLHKKYKSIEKPEVNFVHLPHLTLGLVLMLGLKLSLHSSDPFTSLESGIKMSYLLGDWTGKKQSVPGNVQESKVWFRTYLKDEKLVEVIITSSGGNRHHLHPPEYCLTGSGWKISEKKTSKYTFSNSKEYEIGELALKREGATRHFIHWYTDGESVYPDYLSMLAEDTFRRFQGKRTNWYLFRILAAERQTLTEDFLKTFSGELKQKDFLHF